MRKIFLILIFFLAATVKFYSQASWTCIPETDAPNTRFALIIGNENYQTYASRFTEDVLHAIYDAERFKNAIEKNKLVNKRNSFFYPDAVNTNIKLLLSRISKLRSQDQDIRELIFYFNGKISYDDQGDLYLVPIDATENQYFYSISLEEVCIRIKEAGLSKAWIFIDACRSGVRKGPGLLEISGSKLNLTADIYQGIDIYLPDGDAWRSTPGIEDERINAGDYVPPRLLVSSPLSGESGSEKECIIEGKATDESGIYAVAVNGEEAHVNIDGTFSAKIILEEGKNEILIEAFDEFLNQKSQTVPYFYIPDNSNTGEDGAGTANFYAVLIGINQYTDPMVNNLDGPIDDLNKLSRLLKDQYNFQEDNIIRLYNSPSNQIMEALQQLISTVKPDDNLMLVFSGHGIWDEKIKKGYWLPANAEANNRKNWICNSDVTSIVSKLPTQHTLIIADACFSGGIFRTRGLPTEAGFDILKKYESPSRGAMTSGDLKEVPDNSSFMFYLLKFLKENKERYQTAEQIYYQLKVPVMESTNNIPQYGKIKNSGDQGGDFIFLNMKSTGK